MSSTVSRRTILLPTHGDVDFAASGATAAGFGPLMKKRVDVSDLSAVEQAMIEVSHATGQVDFLANNAGIDGPGADVVDRSTDAWRKVLSVDLIGVFLCCRVVLPTAVSRGCGRVVNVSSSTGREGDPKIAAYAAREGRAEHACMGLP